MVRVIPGATSRLVDYTMFASATNTRELDITMGEEVAVLGYPLGLRHRTTNLPLIRVGTIATHIGEALEDDFIGEDGVARRRVLRGFLVDGATVPGSAVAPLYLSR